MGRELRRFITANGRTLALVEWARETGLSMCCILNRLRRGATPEEAVNPARRYRRGGPVRIEWEGGSYTAAALAKIVHVAANELRRRWRKGLRGADLVQRMRQPARPVIWQGQRKTLAQWGAALGLTPQGLRTRIDAGWDLEAALTTPSRRLRREQE